MLRVLIDGGTVDPRMVFCRGLNFGQRIPDRTAERYVVEVDRSTFLALLEPVYDEFRREMIVDERYTPFTDELERLKDAGWPDLGPLVDEHAGLAEEVIRIWLSMDVLEGLLSDHSTELPRRYLCNTLDRVRFEGDEFSLEGDAYRFDVASTPAP
jgi:hypothetical protein